MPEFLIDLGITVQAENLDAATYISNLIESGVRDVMPFNVTGVNCCSVEELNPEPEPSGWPQRPRVLHYLDMFEDPDPADATQAA